jgi:hypothetical protein
MRCGFEYYRTLVISSDFLQAHIKRDGMPNLPVLSVAGGPALPTQPNRAG